MRSRLEIIDRALYGFEARLSGRAVLGRLGARLWPAGHVSALTIDTMARHDGRMRNYAISRDGATIWRQGATPDELVRVEAIDVQLHRIEAARAELSRERQALIGRACKRGRRQSDKKLAAE